jgi:hypothetical protein
MVSGRRLIFVVGDFELHSSVDPTDLISPSPLLKCYKYTDQQKLICGISYAHGRKIAISIANVELDGWREHGSSTTDGADDGDHWAAPEIDWLSLSLYPPPSDDPNFGDDCDAAGVRNSDEGHEDSGGGGGGGDRDSVVVRDKRGDIPLVAEVGIVPSKAKGNGSAIPPQNWIGRTSNHVGEEAVSERLQNLLPTSLTTSNEPKRASRKRANVWPVYSCFPTSLLDGQEWW